MRVRLTMLATYRTAVGTATVTVSDVYSVDADATDDELTEVLVDVLRSNVAETGHRVVGEVTVKRFVKEVL